MDAEHAKVQKVLGASRSGGRQGDLIRGRFEVAAAHKRGLHAVMKRRRFLIWRCPHLHVKAPCGASWLRKAGGKFKSMCINSLFIIAQHVCTHEERRDVIKVLLDVPSPRTGKVYKR